MNSTETSHACFGLSKTRACIRVQNAKIEKHVRMLKHDCNESSIVSDVRNEQKRMRTMRMLEKCTHGILRMAHYA